MRSSGGARQVRGHPHRRRGRRGDRRRAGARRAPDDELDLAPMADGGPGFVDVLHAALGGELLAVTVRGAVRRPRRRRPCCSAGDTAYVETRAGVRPAPDRAARAPSGPRRYGVGELLAGRGRHRGDHGRPRAGRQRHQRRRRRSARRAGRHRPTARWTRASPTSASVTRVDLGPARERVGGRAAGRRHRRRQPAHRAVRRDQDVRPPEGHPRGATCPGVDGSLEGFARATDQRTSLEPGAGAAGGLGFALLLLGATREPGIELVADAVRLRRAGRARPTWCSPARAPSTSPAAPARCRTASPRSPRRRCGRAWRWPARCWSAPARCGRSASSRRTRWSTWSARSARSPSRPAVLSELAARVARTWSR